MFKMKCPHCDTEVTFRDEDAGKLKECLRCQNTISITRTKSKVKRNVLWASIGVVCIVLVMTIVKKNAYIEIAPKPDVKYSYKVAEWDGVTAMTIWEATYLFPLGKGTIRVWDEIGKDVSWLQLKLWRNDDYIYEAGSPLEKKTVCSCTPLRSIIDYREQPPKHIVTKKTAAAYLDSSEKKAESSTQASKGPEHIGCSDVTVLVKTTSIYDEDPSNLEFIEELAAMAKEQAAEKD